MVSQNKTETIKWANEIMDVDGEKYHVFDGEEYQSSWYSFTFAVDAATRTESGKAVVYNAQGVRVYANARSGREESGK